MNEETYRFRRWTIIIAFVAIGVLQTVLWLYLSRPLQSASIVAVSEVTLLTSPVVCPGDMMRFQYDVEASQSGVLSMNVTVRVVDGPTVMTLPRREIIVEQPMTFTVEQIWHVPLIFDSLHGGREGWKPGDYTRLIAFTSIGEERTPVIRQTPFSLGACSFTEGNSDD